MAYAYTLVCGDRTVSSDGPERRQQGGDQGECSSSARPIMRNANNAADQHLDIGPKTVLLFDEVGRILEENVFRYDPELRDEIQAAADSSRNAMASRSEDPRLACAFKYANWYGSINWDRSAPRAFNDYGFAEIANDLYGKDSKDRAQTSSTNDEGRNEFVLYMNAIDGRLHLFPTHAALERIDLLNEFVEIGRPFVPLGGENPAALTKCVLKYTDGCAVDAQDLLNAHRFLSALIHAICGEDGRGDLMDDITSSATKPSKWTPAQEQLYFTREYVERHIDPMGDMPAQCAVINVYKYVTARHSRPETFNATQASRDLVELGVKKIRKTKGIFYGLRHDERKYDIRTATAAAARRSNSRQ